jgi:16S rRNA (guanine1207-N2)-methyltransferase
MASEHYFSSDPASTLRTAERTLTLRGHKVELLSASGTFSSGSLDKGTAQLLKYVPSLPAEGTFADVGCGWGPLTIAMALESPAAHVWGIDVNDRALHTTRENARSLKLSQISVSRPEDVPASLTFDVIWSNPPIRVGKEELHQILIRWLPRLAPQGEAWLVVAKKLGGDSLQAWINAGNAGPLRADRHETSKGYRILRIQKI